VNLTDNLAAARRYLAAIESGATGEVLSGFFTPDIVQHEFPNRLTPDGATRDLRQILEGAERGRRVLRSQRYEVLNALESGDNVALEVQWTGTLSIPVGGLPAGATMRARFAVFLEYREGRIACQRNYDCFDPW
jgi:ketosteroid isomerase-like protein